MSNTNVQTQNQRKGGENMLKISMLTGNPIKMRIELPFSTAILKTLNDEILTLKDAQDNPIFKIIISNTNKLEQYALILKDTTEIKFTLENEFETEMEALKATLDLKEKASKIFEQIESYLKNLEKIKEEIQYV